MNRISRTLLFLHSMRPRSSKMCRVSSSFAGKCYCTQAFDDETNSKGSVSAKDLLEEAHSSQHRESAEFLSDEAGNASFNSWKQDQTVHSFRPKVDPRETSILLFPGQGSQFVGMGKDLLQYPNVARMFKVANKILGYDLLDICLNGPIAKLNRTVYCQPAIFVTSLAAVEKLRDLNPQAVENCVSTAGFSVGEFAALVFSGAIPFPDALEVVNIRARAMQEASEEVASGMMTVFLRPDHKINLAMMTARRYCEEVKNIDRPVCNIANFLYPECKVIAGNMEALQFIQENREDFGIKRTKMLPVSGAFHTNLMYSARRPVEKALRSVNIEVPIIPVHSNVNSYKYKHPQFIKEFLVKQITSPVKWEQTMHVLFSRSQKDEFPFTYEPGPGSQLGSLLKMTNKKAHNSYTSISV